jgi:hypothetical protein
MSSLFSAPKIPAPPPPAPERDDKDVQDAALKERLRRSRARGRAANILTGGQGVAEPLQAARKRLLGE